MWDTSEHFSSCRANLAHTRQSRTGLGPGWSHFSYKRLCNRLIYFLLARHDFPYDLWGLSNIQFRVRSRRTFDARCVGASILHSCCIITGMILRCHCFFASCAAHLCGRRLQRDLYFIAEQVALAPHLAHPEGCAALRIVLVAVPRVSRSCQHFPDSFDVHLLQTIAASEAMGHPYSSRVQGYLAH